MRATDNCDSARHLRSVARMAGSYSVFTTALQSFQGFEGE